MEVMSYRQEDKGEKEYVGVIQRQNPQTPADIKTPEEMRIALCPYQNRSDQES